MSTNSLSRLILLLLVATLAEVCGAGKSRVPAPSNNSLPAVSNNSSPAVSNSTANLKNSTANRGAVRTKLYRDPDNAFTLNLPKGWRVEREVKDDAYMTVILPEEGRAANLTILTGKAPPPEDDSAEMRSHRLYESSHPLFLGWSEGLREQARVEGEDDPAPEPMQLDQTDALRMDLTYYRDDADDPRRGRCIYLIGDKTTFFISLTASRSRFGELEEIVSTIRIEP